MSEQAIEPRTGESLYISGEELRRARQRIRERSWQAAAAHLRAEADRLLTAERALPAFDSSWYDANPGRLYDETYRQFTDYAIPAWLLAQETVKLLRAGLVFEDQRCLARAHDWLTHLVNNFKFHVKHHDAGLNYSLTADAMAEGWLCLGDRLSADETARLSEQMANCGQALRESTQHWLENLAHMPYNNHFAHHRRALLALGLALGRPEWIDEALTGPRNFGELLAGGTTDDGLCYESSTLYHYGTLAGLQQIAELVRHQPSLGRDLYRETFANGRNLKQMFDGPLGLLWPNGELPAAGDCYANRQPLWKNHPAAYERAYAVYGDPRYAWLLQKNGERSSLEALLFGAERIEPAEPPLARTRLWVEHGYALLASRTGRGYWDGQGVAAFLTGDLSGIHHHRDKLTLQVSAGGRLWVEDVESLAVELHGFSAPIQETFNRTTLAHNTVMVDEQTQPAIARPLAVAEFKELPACRTVAMADYDGWLAEGVRQMRSVAVTPDYCLDLFQAAAETEHVYDWLMHPRSDGPVNCPLALGPMTLPERAPYLALRSAATAEVGAEGLAMNWSQGEEKFAMTVSLAGGAGQAADSAGGEAAAGGDAASATAPAAQLIRAEWPVKSDWSTGGREMFMLRVRAARADFVALYQLLAGDRPWRVESAARLFNGLDNEFRITVTNGLETRQHVLRGLA